MCQITEVYFMRTRPQESVSISNEGNTCVRWDASYEVKRKSHDKFAKGHTHSHVKYIGFR